MNDAIAIDAGVRAATQKCREYAEKLFVNDDWTLRVTSWDDGDFWVELWTGLDTPEQTEWPLLFHQQRLSYQRSDARLYYTNVVEQEYEDGRRTETRLDERELEDFCP